MVRVCTAVKRILKGHLKSRFVITAINVQSVWIIIFSAVIIGWTEKELDNLDSKIEFITLYCMVHKNGEINRLYLKRLKGLQALIITLHIL